MRSALWSIYCPILRPLIVVRARILTVIPTDTFDQFDARVYPHRNENGDEYDTDNIAYRLLVSCTVGIDEIAGDTRWRWSRRYRCRITHVC